MKKILVSLFVLLFTCISIQGCGEVAHNQTEDQKGSEYESLAELSEEESVQSDSNTNEEESMQSENESKEEGNKQHLFEDEADKYISITKGELKQKKSVSLGVNVYADDSEEFANYLFEIENRLSLHIGAYDSMKEYTDLGFYTPNYIASMGDDEALSAIIEICIVDINDDGKKEAIVSYGGTTGSISSKIYELTNDSETGKDIYTIIGQADGEGSLTKEDIEFDNEDET